MRPSIILLLLSASVVLGPALAQCSEIDGMLGLTPVGQNTYVAAEIPQRLTAGLRGIQWFNNDAYAIFPKVITSVGPRGGPPSIGSGTEQTLIAGKSWDWSDLSFSGSISVPEGQSLYVVFQLPGSSEFHADGEGGGAGLGYSAFDGGFRTYVTTDGTEWSPMRPDISVALKLVRWGQEQNESQSVVASTSNISVGGTVLRGVLPNPAHESVSIRFRLAERGTAEVSVYDLRGRRLRQITRTELPHGEHALVWDGRDVRGREVASGVYFLRIRFPDQSFGSRVILMR